MEFTDKRPHVLGIGEALLDCFQNEDGTISGIRWCFINLCISCSLVSLQRRDS